jgi:3D (Asp-Asp-Asp) domain-containing protein
MSLAAIMIIVLVLGTGFERSPEDTTETEEIKSISMLTAEKATPTEAPKSHGRPEFEAITTEKARTEEIRTQEESKLEVVPAVEVVTSEGPEEPGPNMTFHPYAGTYELTAYIETGNPCADGVYPTINHTAACNDPSLWHKWIEIEGYGVYYVHDTGGMASNVIDLFVGSYDEAIQFGRREAEVYIIE